MKPHGTACLPAFLLYALAFAAGSGITSTLLAAAPPVTITSPTNGSVLAAPASFTIRASVSGGGHSVTQIEFFADSTSLGVDAANPYRLDVNNLAAGSHTLSAILTDNAGDTSTNSVTILVNELPRVEITNPLDGAGLIGPASFQLEATAFDLDGSVTSVRFFRDKTTIGVVSAPPYRVPVNKLGAGNYTFEAVATDDIGGIQRARIDVVVKQRPTITITAPASGARLTEMANLFTGTADDSRRVELVEFSVNGGDFTPATGTRNWEAPLVLPAGTNVLRARAIDSFGNYSLTNSRTVFQVVTSALTLRIEGAGTVSGATDGQILEVGRGYRLVALPGSGYLFSNWTGHASSAAPTLNFLMQTGMILQANFVPNPFLRVNGKYNGLFFETDDVRHESSGDFQLRVNSSGRYRAALRFGGRRLTASGVLDLEGRATNVIVRMGTTPLTIRWAVNLNGLDQVTATVSDGVWTSELLGDRAVFNATTNPAALAGRYTFVLPPGAGVGAPDAYGQGTLRVTPAGLVIGAGCLPDGTKFSRKAPVSKNGVWPLYAPLYESKGCLIGWVQFDTNAPLNDAVGLITSIKPQQPGGTYYAAGFTNFTTLIASRYIAPTDATSRVLDLTNGVLILSGGGLSQAWTNEFVLGENNKVINGGADQVTVAISPATGLFKGSFFDPGLNRAVNFSGALLQKSTNGAGFFLGPDQSGSVIIESRP